MGLKEYGCLCVCINVYCDMCETFVCICVQYVSVCVWCMYKTCVVLCLWVSVGDLCVRVWGLCIHVKSRDKNLDVYLYHCCSIFSVAVIKTFSPKETWGNWGRVSLAYTVRLTVHH